MKTATPGSSMLRSSRCFRSWVTSESRDPSLGRSSASSIADILWHSTKSMTQHYSVAQIVELNAALEKIRDDSGRWNKSLAMLRWEEGLTEDASPPKVPQQRKTA